MKKKPSIQKNYSYVFSPVLTFKSWKEVEEAWQDVSDEFVVVDYHLYVSKKFRELYFKEKKRQRKVALQLPTKLGLRKESRGENR